jgi:hypothetical protein
MALTRSILSLITQNHTQNDRADVLYPTVPLPPSHCHSLSHSHPRKHPLHLAPPRISQEPARAVVGGGADFGETVEKGPVFWWFLAVFWSIFDDFWWFLGGFWVVFDGFYTNFGRFWSVLGCFLTDFIILVNKNAQITHKNH